MLKSKINTILPIALAVILPGLSLYSSVGLEVMENIGFFGSWIISSLILYGLWYLLWYLWDIKSGRIWWYGFILAGFFGIVILVASILDFPRTDDPEWFYLLRIVMAAILFLAIQYALKAQQNISSLQLEKEQMQTENYKAQVKALQAKIDPHFLFNSLNTLRSMVKQQHENSDQFIMSLSDFYRQTLKYNENTTLPLSEELSILQSYLFLMKSRNEDAVVVNVSIDDELHQHHLPTLALQIVVENCFKHNSMASKNPLHIEIGNNDDYYIVINNNIQPKIGDKDENGLGLEILRKRYELMNIHNGVIIREMPDQFSVKLRLI